MEKKSENIFEKASFYVFISTIVLGILAFISPSYLPLSALKTAIIGIGVLVSLILYLYFRFQTKSVDLPLHPLVYVGGLLGMSVVISSFTSASPLNSFMGTTFGAGTGIFLLIVLVAAILSVFLVNSRERIFLVYITVLGTFGLVALFQIIRLAAGVNFLQLGTFTSLTSTMLGSWYDFNIFAGFALIMSLLTIRFFSVSKRLHMFSYILLIVSLLFLILIGASFVWLSLAIITLGISIYEYMSIRKNTSQDSSKTTWLSKVPLIPVIICVIALGFLWKGIAVTGSIATKLNATYAEVSLPWQYTLDVAEPTIKAAPLFGAGPDRFINQFLGFKPEAINQTQFWNVPFPSGQSFVLTTLVTEGIVGFVLWILLIIALFKKGVESLQTAPKDKFAQYSLVSSFFAMAFLWMTLLVYVPSHAMILVTFVMTGIWAGIYFREHSVHSIKTISWLEGGKGKNPIVIGIAVVALFSLAGIVFLAKQTVAEFDFQAGGRAVSADTSVSASTLATAKSLFQSATTWNARDTYYDALAQLDIYAVNQIVSNASTTPSPDTVTNIGNLITEAVNDVHKAESLDPSNSYNYITEASVYETAASLKVKNGYENAKTAYSNALQLDPMNPSTYLSLAKLDYFATTTAVAMSDLNAAVQLKPDYTDAYFEAGLISYQGGDYQAAESFFVKTLQIDNTYANASYFLSLTLVRLGDTKDAITQLTSLAQVYPNSTQISTVLNDLKKGVSPFNDASQAAAANTVTNIASSSSAVSAAEDSMMNASSTSVMSATSTTSVVPKKKK